MSAVQQSNPVTHIYTMRYRLTLGRMATIHTSTKKKYCRGCGEKRNLPTLLLGMSAGATTVENCMVVPQKTKYRTATWSSNPTSGHISGQDYYSKITSPPICIAALFTTAKTWRQPECPPTDGRLKKMWSMSTTDDWLLSSGEMSSLAFSTLITRTVLLVTLSKLETSTLRVAILQEYGYNGTFIDAHFFFFLLRGWIIFPLTFNITVLL